jgi:hypothetical protein
MIRATSSTKEAADLLGRIRVAVEDGGFDQPVEIAAWRCRTELIERTPKKWTGLTRRAWQVEKIGTGTRLVTNKSKVMLFLEEGTGNAGTATSNGGYIYPKSKKFLFIPKTSTAALSGWRAGMKWGVDFVLARRVRGIQAMRIVARFRERSQEILREEMRTFLKRIIK